MIFVTVGTQLPFNRLISWVDTWAASHPSQEVFVQCGAGGLLPNYAKYTTEIMTPDIWQYYFQKADLIVSHAGMGTILKSLAATKPLVVVPRIAELNEHRNNHQLATVHQLKSIVGLTVVEDEHELNRWLNTPPICNVAVKQENTNLNLLCEKLTAYVNQSPN